MRIYIIAIDDGGWFTPLYFFHSFQEAEDNVKDDQTILRMELGKVGYSVFFKLNKTWLDYTMFEGID